MEICTTEYSKKEIPKIQGEIYQDAHKYIRLFPIDDQHDQLYMKGYVGAINLTKNCTLYSYPKVGISNVLKMYDYSTKIFPTKDYDIELKEETNFLDLLTRIFIDEVETICRTAYRRFYALKIENLLTIKGKILVSETIQRNWLQPHVQCEYQEFTDDILDNQILKFATYIQLKAYTGNQRSYGLLNRLRNLYSFFDNVSLHMLNARDVDTVIYDRLNSIYSTAHKLSRFFIEYLHVSHGYGEHGFYSFMINMEKLFEDYVRNTIRLFNLKYSVIDGNRGKKRFLDMKETFTILKPDVMLEQNKTIKLVLDCKYKKIPKIPEDDEVEVAKPLPSDVYQMLSYLVGMKCPQGVLVYPKDECEDAMIPIKVEEKEYMIYVKQIDLTQINQNYLSDFAVKMDDFIT